MSKELLLYNPDHAKIPLTHVPLIRIVPQMQIMTARHELKHARMARQLGIKMIGLTTIPDGNTLGCVEITPTSYSNFALFLLAPYANGEREGCEDDLDMARQIIGEHKATLLTNVARTLLDKLDPEIENKMAEIIAYIGEIDETQLGDIEERAKYELNHQNQAA